MHGPVRIPHHLARQRHEVATAVREIGLGLHRVGDQAHRHGRDFSLAADALGERHVIAGTRGTTASVSGPSIPPDEQSITSTPR